MQELGDLLSQYANDLFRQKITAEIVPTEPKFGDYATNIALKLAVQAKSQPQEIAEKLIEQLTAEPKLADYQFSVAAPGFINIKLPAESLRATIARQALGDLNLEQSLKGQVIVCEYSDPNPFKMLHAGHLYTSVVGEAIANLLTKAGADVKRVNFGGDVGLHVAKSMWSILQFLDGENYDELNKISEEKRAFWLGERYSEGHKAFQSNPEIADQIRSLNQKIYEITNNNDHGTELARIYWTCRQWSYDYLSNFYEQIGTKFDRYYPESETVQLGLKTVKEQTEHGTFEKSEGAIVFKGEKVGLHTRVFITKEGLPTYETKDIGLLLHKYEDYRFDRSIVITGNDIVDYMRVILAAAEKFVPDLVNKTTHLTHGMVKLAGGAKMSSREGNILSAEDVLENARRANQQLNDTTDETVALGAVKYAFTKQRLGADIIYNPEESVSLEGNSGPYLQYSLVRAKSILRRIGEERPQKTSFEYLPDERKLTIKLFGYAEVIQKATIELQPSAVCSYLHELAQEFNRFYENNRIADDPRQEIRAEVLDAYTNVLQDGLAIIGVSAPESM